MRHKILLALLLAGSTVPTWAEVGVAANLSGTASVQQDGRKVTGKVLDENGEPVIGASIKVTGTTTGTITDFDGNFTLNNVPKGAKIEISYIGYLTQTVEAKGNEPLTIKLAEDNQMLDEVVVVGYGTQRVKDLTGSATNVKVEDIIDLPGASLVDALAGQVVGLSVNESSGRPGATGSFTIRQPMSFDESSTNFNQPLIVIDDIVQVDENGEPSMTAFNMLDPSEIETMTVLKDASAAVYGARASSGVILVKTKRGKAGKPSISYSAKLDFADAVSHAKVMSPYELGVFTNRMFDATDRINENNNMAYYKYSDEELERLKTMNYDWLDRAWHSSLSHRHALNVQGGSETVTYFAGITYQNQDTNLGEVQDFDKWTFRAGGEINVAAGLKLSASVSGYSTNQTEVNDQAKIGRGPWGPSSTNDYLALRHMPGYIPVEYTINDPTTGNPTTYFVSPWNGPQDTNSYTDSSLGDGIQAWNFFANEASGARNNHERNGYNANFSLNWEVPFIKGLSIKGTYSISYDNSLGNEVGAYYSLARATNIYDPGMHLLGDNSTWTVLNYGDPNSTALDNKPTVTYAKSTSKSEQMNLTINYARTFGQHDVSGTFVIERAENEGHEEQLYYQGPGQIYNGTSSTSGTLSQNGSQTYFHKYESGALSYIGRFNYKYGERYLAQFLFRADASTKFAPENYWGFFPTGSFGWVVSEENFFKKSKLADWIDFLKVRYSIGKTGKDNVAAWTWLQIYNISPTSGLGFGSLGGMPTSGASINGTVNRDIRWDTTIKNNVGIDINLLKNRLSVSTDFYYDKTKDLIMAITDAETPIYIGAALPNVNYGKKDAWGWEISARWNDQIEQSLLPSWGPIKYSIGMDYSISWNKTVLGQEPTFDYPGYIENETSWTGYRGMGHEWGFKTWKHTSGGDGILRTQEDIDNYWQYLTDLATAAGTTPSYLGIESKEEMELGMLAYQDLRGDIDTANETIAGPNGRVSDDHSEDFAKLANNRRHGINTKLGLQWGNFSWSAQISTSWGGYNAIDIEETGVGSDDFIWSQFSIVNDMFDPVSNPNGKYPSMAVDNAWSKASDFWQVSSFRMYVRNMRFAYTLPKEWTSKLKIDKLQLSLTGNNLWDFHNPFPDHYRNMYDDTTTGYPTLRTWTLGINLTL